MDLETAQNNVAAKLSLLKQENGNSFKPVARITTNADGTSTSTIRGPVTTKEKAHKKNDVKARSMLLMALPNEHLLTFNQYKDAQTLFAIIHARFGGNDATKKTQKTLLKNKSDLDIMSFDDLYNNFKIVEQEVKRTVTRSSSSGYMNMAFISSPSSTNEVDTATIQVSTVNTPVSTPSTHDNTAKLSDAIVYAFLANYLNGSQLIHKDLEQIHEDDLEGMDLKWQQCRGPRNQENRPRNQDNRNWNQDSSTRTIHVEDTSSKAIVAINGAGFDWSFIEDEEVPTDMDFMPFSDSELNKSEFDLATYKRGLASVEERLVFYKKNAVMFSEQITVLKRDITYKDFNIKDEGYVDSGCSSHMTGNMSYLSDFKEFNGGYVTFGGGANGGKITSKGTLKTDKLDFEDVYFVKELQFNIF
ncbi:hypothetical protein Tco_0265351 [Tanacetum coccineum]